MINILFSILSLVQAKTFRIAVIDTGINYNYLKDIKVCWDESLDITKTDFIAKDNHGSNVTNLIAREVEGLDYCIIVIKFRSGNANKDNDNYIKALEHVKKIKPDLLNLSLGGNFQDAKEKKLIEDILTNDTIIVAAAGNQGENLDESCSYYPACYFKEIVIVGNLTDKKVKYSISNYGKVVSRWEVGTNVTAGGITLTGTSMSCGVASGKIARDLILKRSKK